MFLISNDCWKIRKTKDKGYGIFAQKTIQAGTIIGDYLGTVIKTAEYDLAADARGLYLMYLTDEACIYPDLAQPGIHLFNHSCVPNCWIYMYRGHTLFFALGDISPGEELTISYLLSPKDELCNPCIHICKCGHESCTSSMHMAKEKYEKWQMFQTKERKKTKTAPFVFGETLPELSFYPAKVLDTSIYEDFI